MSKFKEKWRFQFPEYASYEVENKKIYDNFKSTKSSFFFRREYTQIFLAAMALGYHKKERKPLTRKSHTIPTNVFNLYERWMIISLAIEEEKDVSILKNEAKILSIAEEYANGGIKYLNSIQDDDLFENSVDSFEKELRKQLDQL